MFSWFKKKDSDSEQPPASAPQPSTPGDEPEPKSNAMESASQPAAPPVSEPRKGGFFSRVVRGLFKTRETLVKRVRKAIGLRARLDQELLDEIEEILIQADVGVATTKKIIDDLRLNVSAGESSEAVMTQLRSSMRAILQRNERVFSVDIARKPYIVLVVGVNGTGKTTTIGKIAQKLIAEGKRVTLVAADTFRAAAIEQLSIWGERVGARVIRGQMGSDAASVCYRAMEETRTDGSDVVLIDTAGRLHTKKHLMDELEKIVRVIKKVEPDAPHETLLVLDATTGQNAMNQAKTFAEIGGVTGIVMTKLDGTAKGGILIALRDQFDMPVLMIGVGETADDLRPFDAQEFIDALFTEEE